MARIKSNFFFQRFLLRLCGISLRENESILYKIFSFSFLVFICAYPFLTLMIMLAQKTDDIDELFKYQFIYSVAVIKAVIVRLQCRKLGKLLDQLEPDSFINSLRFKGRKEEELIKLCNIISNMQSYIYWGFTVVAYTGDVLYSLSKRLGSSDYHDWQFTFGYFNVVDATHSPNFEILWAYQNFACFCLGTLFIMIDATMGGILCHICFELKIFQNNLRNIVETSLQDMLQEKHNNEDSLVENTDRIYNYVEDPKIEWKYLHKSINRSVEYYLAIMNIIQDLNETFSSLLLMTFLGTLGMLTLMIYQAAMLPFNNVKLFTSLGEIVSITFQVFLVCFWSEEMMYEGEQVGTAAYEASFVGTDLRFQKALVLIMRRSQTPLVLGAGQFVDIRLSTFLWITKSAYSVYTVLRKHNAESIQ